MESSRYLMWVFEVMAVRRLYNTCDDPLASLPRIYPAWGAGTPKKNNALS